MKRKSQYYWRSTDMPCFLVTYQKAGRKDKLNLPGTALHFYIFDYVFDGEHGV